MKRIIKNNLKYIFLFIFFFCCLQFFYVIFSIDRIYNYGFSYAISRGEIPYNDFNMIIPPMGAFIYAIPFALFGFSLVAFNLFQAFLLCLLFKFLFKLFGKNAYILLIGFILTIPIPVVVSIFQGYNFLLLFELVLLLYLEKIKANDYLIGIVLGIAVLTKQTVGVALCLVSLYYLFKDYKKILKRISGFLIPCAIFFVYLLVTKSLYNFFDMCLFGMFDFTSENGGVDKFFKDYYFYFFLLEFGFLIYKIYKDKNNLMYYYLLAFSLIAVPLFDYNHVSYFTFPLMFVFMDKIKIENKTLGFNACFAATAFSLIWFMFMYGFKIPYIVSYDNFELFITTEKDDNENKYLKKFLKKYPDTIILAENTYFTKISMNLDIDHYDLLNRGNHGYNGTDKLIKRLDNEKNKFILVNMVGYNRKSIRQQLNKEVIRHVIENYELKGELGDYAIYYKK